MNRKDINNGNENNRGNDRNSKLTSFFSELCAEDKDTVENKAVLKNRETYRIGSADLEINKRGKDDLSIDDILKYCEKSQNQDMISKFSLPRNDGQFSIENRNMLLDYIAVCISEKLEAEKAFKGGYLLNLLAKDSRRTVDVDLSICEKESYERAKEILQEIGEALIEKGYAIDYDIKPDISERASGGIKIYAENGETIASVDIGLHPLDYGISGYNLKIGEIEGFTVERMLSDKITALTTRKRFRRTKDLYDFNLLVSKYDISMDKMLEAMKDHDPEWKNVPFSETILTEYRYAWDKLKLSSQDNNALYRPDFDLIIQKYYKFVEPFISGREVTRWNRKSEKWEV